jgi:GNAT superfamily N-acetyltransferase
VPDVVPRVGGRATMGAVIIRAPLDRELPGLVEIERAAGDMFRRTELARVADDEPRPVEWIRRFAAEDLVRVALDDGDDEPVAYLVAEPVDGNLHVEQVSVHPRAARRGFGRALLDHAAGMAAERGLAALTLTTFADVPWNAPYYERLGFVRVPEDDLQPSERQRVSANATGSLGRWPRVAMRRPVQERVR